VDLGDHFLGFALDIVELDPVAFGIAAEDEPETVVKKLFGVVFHEAGDLAGECGSFRDSEREIVDVLGKEGDFAFVRSFFRVGFRVVFSMGGFRISPLLSFRHWNALYCLFFWE
jgi:hypothetical protein